MYGRMAHNSPVMAITKLLYIIIYCRLEPFNHFTILNQRPTLNIREKKLEIATDAHLMLSKESEMSKFIKLKQNKKERKMLFSLRTFVDNLHIL